jgi:hypothetical protein
MHNQAMSGVYNQIRNLPDSDKITILRELASSLVKHQRRDDVLRVLSELTDGREESTHKQTPPVSAAEAHLRALRMPRFSLGVFAPRPFMR